MHQAKERKLLIAGELIRIPAQVGRVSAARTKVMSPQGLQASNIPLILAVWIGGIMRKFIENSIGVLLLVGLVAVISYGQSLGDVAREQRQKQQAKNTQPNPKVVTNEDLPEHPDAEQSTSGNPQGANPDQDLTEKKPAEQWKQEIQEQKQSVVNLQVQMDRLNSSIHFAPGNCVRNCVQYNEHQVEKQDEVQRMQAELEQQKKRLEDMQEAARKQGYGNSVWEPN
jgi:hypothetical protein